MSGFRVSLGGAQEIYKIKPDLIITHDKEDYHSDHKILSKIVSEIAGHYIPIIYSETI